MFELDKFNIKYNITQILLFIHKILILVGYNHLLDYAVMEDAYQICH